MTEYSRIAKGSFTATGTTAVVNLPFVPDYVELWNYTNIKTAATHSVTRAWWDAALLDGANNPTMVELYSGSSTSVVFDQIANTSTSLGINPFSAGLLLQYGASQQVVASTKGTTTSFQVTGHGYAVGDVVLFDGLYQSASTGMPQMAGMPFSVTTVTDANNFIVNWNSNNSSYTNLSASPAGSTVRKILYPYLYLPGTNFISAITTGSTTTIKTTTNHNYEVGQEVAFRIPSAWGTTQLNSLPNTTIPGSPIYGYVTSITDNLTFVVNINSSSYTAYTTAVAVANVPGLTWPQVTAVGDVNTGGITITSTSALYPSPQFPTSSSRIATINGPAIRGSYVSNTAQGFTIGAGLPVVDNTSTATLIANTNIVYWHAYKHDFSSP
jgi:hypothetical protein